MVGFGEMSEYFYLYRHSDRDYYYNYRDHCFYTREDGAFQKVGSPPLGTRLCRGLDYVVLMRDGFNSLTPLPGATRLHYLYDLEHREVLLRVVGPDEEDQMGDLVMVVPQEAIPEGAREERTRVEAIRTDIRNGVKYKAIRGAF